AHFVADPRGNLTQLLNDAQEVVATFSYDPYGKEKPELSSKVAGWDSRLRFQMAPKDPATGAYNLGPRLYDPGISRFVGADFYAGAAANLELALDPLTANRYLYAGANPANFIDDGHGPIEWLRKKLQPFIHAPCGVGGLPGEQDRTISSVCLMEGVELRQVQMGPFSVLMPTISKRAVATPGEKTGKGGGKKRRFPLTDRYKRILDQRHLKAAWREQRGEVVARKPDGTPYNHVKEVEYAQQGLLNRITRLTRRLGRPGLGQAEREAALMEVGEASRLLDYSELYVPRQP
ncbi:MAG: polymorphic toxin type 28 domain-containing protein, partial [Candidatus Methylomirabilales bacterium]